MSDVWLQMYEAEKAARVQADADAANAHRALLMALADLDKAHAQVAELLPWAMYCTEEYGHPLIHRIRSGEFGEVANP